MFNVKCLVLISIFILFLSIYVTILIRLNNIGEKNYDLYSSAWCEGQSIYEKRCRFRNLCYKVDSKEFILILDKRSLMVNLPQNRFQPSLQFLGSVEHNSFYFNYVEVEYSLYRRFFSKQKFILIKNPTLIYARFKPDNLMHNLHDDLLPLYHTLTLISSRKSTLINRPSLTDNFNLLIFDDYYRIDEDYFTKNFFSTIFKNINLIYKNDFMANNQMICFENAEIGLEKSTVWYDYGFKHVQKPIDKTTYDKNLIRLYTNRIKNSLLKYYNLNDRICDEFYATLIIRKKSRLLLNEDQLIKQLEISFGYKVEKIDLDNELEIFNYLFKISCSKVMIGMHGGGLILSMFLPENANLIELFPYKINASHYTPYKQLASIYNLNYFTWTNKVKANSFFNLKYLREDIKNQIYDDREVEVSLCCDEPYFLFRIYQDTIVDIDEMSKLFAKVTNLSIKKSENVFEVFPSKVLITCNRGNKKIYLNWTKPWNLVDLENMRYEVLISHKQNSSIYQIENTELVIDIDNNVGQLLIWIRAIKGEVRGPFDDKPLYC